MKRVNKKLKKYIDENIFPSYKKNDLVRNTNIKNGTKLLLV